MYKFVLFFTIVMLSVSCSQNKNEGKAKAKKLVVPVKTMVVQPKNLDYTVHSTGTLLANEEVELRSEISGRVIKIYFEEGQYVTKGTSLIKIEDSELKAQFKKIQLQVELANLEENRSKSLLDQKGISQQDYDLALNKLNSLKADADFIQAQLNKTNIIAPFSGMIGLRNVSEGSYISASAILATIQQNDPVKIEFAIPERYASYIKSGSKISFTTAQEKKYTASVYASNQKIDLDTRSLKVRARCNNSNKELVPGSFVKVDVNLEQIKGALVVPSEAIVPVLAGQTIYLYKSGKAKANKVITGIRTDSEVQILDGLNKGDTVITTGIMMLRDGATVKLQSTVN